MKKKRSKIPAYPKGFEPVAEINVTVPKGVEPKRLRNLKPVADLDWPSMGAGDAYMEFYVYSQSKYWLLYVYNDDMAAADIECGESGPLVGWQVVGYARKGKENFKVAAAHLLLSFLKEEWMNFGDDPPVIARAGISKGVIQAICDEVWSSGA